jgi:hypothetical protein
MESIKQSMGQLPRAAGKKDQIIHYPKIKFGRSPDWKHARPLAKAVAVLIGATNGTQVAQNMLANGILKWVEDEKMGFDADEVEKTAYKLRALMSQLRCHC